MDRFARNFAPGHLVDVINCAKFYLNQIRGFESILWWVEFLAFP